MRKPLSIALSLSFLFGIGGGALVLSTAVARAKAQEQEDYLCASITFGSSLYSGSATTLNDSSVQAINLSLSSIDGSSCFRGEGTSLRLGSSKNSGSFTVRLADSVSIARAKIYAFAYDDKGPEITFSTPDSETTYTQSVTAVEEPDISDNSKDAGVVFTVSSGPVSSFTISGKYRSCICKIVLTLGNGSYPVSSNSETSSTIISSTASSSSSSSSSSSVSSDSGDVPTISYYDGIDWSKTGAALKSELSSLIVDHTDLGYDGLLNAYKTTDTDENGYIVDMYSNKSWSSNYSGGNYSGEGDMWNREHIVPQSVFSEKQPMKSDIFHVYPTDGYVNNRRSNYPHGVVGTAKYTSENGSKVGTSSLSSYSGTVFEPIDRWKGDIARSYFYMVTCYQSQLSGWKEFGAFSKNAYPSLRPWAVELYLQWNDQDPPDEWEKGRNEKAYGFQKNRNPFIDYPEAAHKIWDSSY